MSLRVCVIGRGKVGRSLQRGLREASVAATLIRGRAPQLPRTPADAYLLAVPDARIRTLAEALAPQLARGAVVLHCAGARGVGELAALAAHGVSVGVFHPLVSFARPGAASLRGATFTCSGDRRALAMARRLARKLGAHSVASAEPGPAYHAAAALVANGTAALAHLGTRILVELGFAPRAAERALAALLHSVADNVAHVGVPAALTGPVVRGDSDTVHAHSAALRALDPELARAYASVLPTIVTSARAAGLPPAVARRLLRSAQR